MPGMSRIGISDANGPIAPNVGAAGRSAGRAGAIYTQSYCTTFSETNPMPIWR